MIISVNSNSELRDVIRKRITKHHNNLEAHPTPLLELLVQPINTKKGKAVPLQAWSGPEGSRKSGFPDFMITAQDAGKVVSFTHRPPLPPGPINIRRLKRCCPLDLKGT
jgi:hypothetical protein